MDTPLRVAVLIASTNPAGVGTIVTQWFLDAAAVWPGLKLEPARADAAPDQLRDLVDDADAIVVVTPEYNHSFPGQLKIAIDRLRREWYAKPVGLVTYGGISGGLRAGEQLRLVFAELHAVTIRETLSFANAGDRFDAHGRPHDAAAVEAGLERFIGVLTWWAHALREARANAPYPA